MKIKKEGATEVTPCYEIRLFFTLSRFPKLHATASLFGKYDKHDKKFPPTLPHPLGDARFTGPSSYSTVTLFAKLRGWSTSLPRNTAA